MSFFDSHYQSQYVEKLRRFLGRKQENFLRDAGLVADPSVPRKGKLPAYPAGAVAMLEMEVNRMASHFEFLGASFGERYVGARVYAMVRDADVARAIGVSRELVRRWREGLNTPTAAALEKLGEYLRVPATWLKLGDEHRLPADCRIGLRVGEENLQWRERLYGLTQELITDLSELATDECLQAEVEQVVRVRTDLSVAARRAGGRWLPFGGALRFIAWEPLAARGLFRRDWPEQVEVIIDEELKPTVSTYRASKNVRARCEKAGLPFPTMGALQKRVQKEKERQLQYGRLPRERSMM
jgi:transcriptional regulator with XRE-family HTH domain